MNALKLVGLACLLSLLASIPGRAAAQEWCGAELAGSDGDVAERAPAGAVLVAAADFACGPDLTCDPATQYCYVQYGGPVGVPPNYRCLAAPDAARPPTCETLNVAIGCECSTANGGIRVTCKAP